MIETLCWYCANAYGQCSWSKNFTPVEGWDVEKKDVKVARGTWVESYIVNDCPQFIGEGNEGIRTEESYSENKDGIGGDHIGSEETLRSDDGETQPNRIPNED